MTIYIFIPLYDPFFRYNLLVLLYWLGKLYFPLKFDLA